MKNCPRTLQKSKSLKQFPKNIRNTKFDQSSPVQPNPENKNLKKSEKKNLKKFKLFENIFFLQKKNDVLLVLIIEVISLQSELSSPPRFRIQPGGVL